MQLDSEADGSSSSRPVHLVILVHGINTRAQWISRIKPTLEAAGLKAAPAGYGLYGVTRFLLPFERYRRKAVERVLRRIRAAITLYRPNKVSIISHSFGTYITARILSEEFDLKWHRIIFCGSVVRDDFPVEQWFERYTPPIINEVGTQDIWPAVAESVTWGYGSIGSYGFQGAGIEERWHEGYRHSDFLNPEFCRRYWIPYIINDVIVPGDEPGDLPWWTRWLGRFPLRWVVFLVAPLALLLSVVVNLLDICLLPGCELSMRIERTADFRQSRCADGRRQYRNLYQDVITLNTFVKSYEARWFFEKGANGQPTHTPPIVHDLNLVRDVSVYQEKSSEAAPYFSFPLTVSWLRQARVQWDFQEFISEPPGGVKFVSRYPVSSFEMNILLPKFTEIAPCEDCSDAIDGLTIESVAGNWSQVVREACGVYNRGTRVSCSGVRIPPEAHVTYQFQIKGWDACGKDAYNTGRGYMKESRLPARHGAAMLINNR